MKKLWAILLAVVMVVGALALASCGSTPDATTAASTTAKADTTTAGTTAAETTAASTTAAETTAASTTAAGTTAAETTAAGTTAAETTAAGTTAESTTAEATTTTTEGAAEGTTLPIYARFDFGTDNAGDDNGWVCDHDWIVERIEYSEAYLKLIWSADALQVIAKVPYNAADENKTIDDFAITFNQLVDYAWEGDDLGYIPGWGTWDLMPYSDQYVGVDGRWGGDHQFMQIRLINNSKNNMISFSWSNSASPGFFTTLRCSNMYLQGGEGVNTCDPTTEYATYTYDLMFLNAAASGRFGWGSTTFSTGSLAGHDYTGETAALSFTDFATYKATRLEYPGLLGGNNYNKTRSTQECNGVKFYLLGAADAWQASRASADFCDSRANIVAGASVTVDYIIFGSTVEQLDAYKSKIELGA